MSGAIVVVLLSAVGGSRRKDLCAGGGGAALGDVAEAAEILIDDPFAERQPAPLAIAMNGF